MTDISKYIPEQSKTVAAIYAAYKKAGDAQPTRGYLGASIIGHPCERYLWYTFRQCCKPEFDGRMYRLFETGDLEEARFVKDLRAIGCEVHDTDQSQQPPSDWPKQFEVSALGGHFSGHMDGCALNIPEAPKTWHVLEFKTCNAKSFKDLVKKGVKESKPQHYAQMMAYMHLTGMKRALYLARNKDTDELYSERVRYDKAEAEALIERAKRVITAVAPPDKISNRRDYYLCGWCDASEVCWGRYHKEKSALPVPSLSCRQCCHATPILDREDATWGCEKGEGRYDGVRDYPPCKKHLTLPGLLVFAEPEGYGEDLKGNESIIFKNKDGAVWQHGNADGCFSSEELTKLPVSALTSPALQEAKGLFGATATDCQDDILKRYPEGDSRLVWKGLVSSLVGAWQVRYDEDLKTLEPIGKYDYPDYEAAEFEGGRAIFAWDDGTAEIRQGVE